MRQADRVREDPQIVAMQRITKIDGPIGAKLRDRSRSVKFRLLEIARAARGKVPNRGKMVQAYGKLLDTTARVVGQARRFAGKISARWSNCRRPRTRSSPNTRYLRPAAQRRRLAARRDRHTPNQARPHGCRRKQYPDRSAMESEMRKFG
jgi:hypothetical protein